MAQRLIQLFLGVLAVLGGGVGCSTTADPNRPSLTLYSPRHDLRISYRPCGNLRQSPSLRTWPSYEEWSFGGGTEAAPAYLTVRLTPATQPRRWAAAATDAEVAADWRDIFANPTSETYAEFDWSGRRHLVRHVRNVDAEVLICDDIDVLGYRLSVAFSFDRAGDADRWRQPFSEFVRSLRMEYAR